MADGGETSGELPSSHAVTHAGAAATGREPVRETDLDLARVIDAWPVLPAHIRAAVLALIGTAR